MTTTEKYLIDAQEAKIIHITNINQNPDKPLLLDADILAVNFRPKPKIAGSGGGNPRLQHEHWILGQRFLLLPDERAALRTIGKLATSKAERSRIVMNDNYDFCDKIRTRMEGMR